MEVEILNDAEVQQWSDQKREREIKKQEEEEEVHIISNQFEVLQTKIFGQHRKILKTIKNINKLQKLQKIKFQEGKIIYQTKKNPARPNMERN